MIANSKLAKRIILTGGGTAGHVWPLLVIAEELRRQIPCQFLYIGSQKGLERALVKPFHLYRSIVSGKWRRWWSWANWVDLVKVGVGSVQAWLILKQFKPDLVIAKGGYVSLPVVMAAWLRGITIVTHESDIVMGKTNRLAARIAKRVFVGFPIENYPTQLSQKMIYSGNPVQADFWQLQPRRNLTGQPTRLTCLVMGGSQGARSINRLIFASLGRLLPRVNIIHLTGPADYLKSLNWKSRLSQPIFDRYRPLPFTRRLAYFLSTADLVVSRAGANALAEIGAAAKPAVIIPLPSAAAGHQLANARWYEDRQAVVVLPEEGLTARKLVKVIKELIDQPGRREKLGERIRLLANRQAVQIIVRAILKLLNDN